MNPYTIYRDEWADALRVQLTAPDYTSFVAMPFQERFSYRSRDILEQVIFRAIDEANKRDALPRKFAIPQRVDVPSGAVVVTDEIVRGILQSHIFIADLTFQNAGVILETGIALGTKPNRQIVLIMQGAYEELHFDLRNNRVISYNRPKSVNEIAEALIDAARHFEDQADQHIRSITKRLSPEAILALNWYGQLHKQHKGSSLHGGNLGPFFSGDSGRQIFDRATAELREKDLLLTDYKVGAIPGGDAFGMHATELGWAVIESMWHDLRRNHG